MEGSSVITKSNNFTYFGSPQATVPTGSNTITITPMKIFTQDNPPSVESLTDYSITQPGTPLQ